MEPKLVVHGAQDVIQQARLGPVHYSRADGLRSLGWTARVGEKCPRARLLRQRCRPPRHAHPQIEQSLSIIGEHLVRGVHQHAEFDLVVRRADMPNDPALATDGLDDLHRGRSRGRPHPPHPCHKPSIDAPLSALKAH